MLRGRWRQSPPLPHRRRLLPTPRRRRPEWALLLVPPHRPLPCVSRSRMRGCWRLFATGPGSRARPPLLVPGQCRGSCASSSSRQISARRPCHPWCASGAWLPFVSRDPRVRILRPAGCVAAGRRATWVLWAWWGARKRCTGCSFAGADGDSRMLLAAQD
jgi:hypothetical protein